jgi:hypothetical protein
VAAREKVEEDDLQALCFLCRHGGRLCAR